MESFIAFIEKFWPYLSFGFIFILDLVILITKKFKASVSLPLSSYSQLIDLVNEAESIFGQGNGSKKLNYVLEKYMKSNEIKYFTQEVRYYLEGVIDKLLSTPTKKGGSGRES